MPEMNPEPSTVAASNATSTPLADQKLDALHSLLGNSDDGAVVVIGTANEISVPQTPAKNINTDDPLVQLRLGVASGLFTALRAKHQPTASHSLRVALACSDWAVARELNHQQCTDIEIAALLHDVGKIGIPENLLHKPSILDARETALIRTHWSTGLEILRSCGASKEVLSIVEHTRGWYNGRNKHSELLGQELPLGARILAITDAFDSMTTDHVYRRALSKERALHELLQNAGSQFDPQLVKQFYEWNDLYIPELQKDTSQRWLAQLGADLENSHWRMGQRLGSPSPNSIQLLFDTRLIDQLDDGIVFVDVQLRILRWNQGAEQLTGLTANSVVDKKWLPSLVRLHDHEGHMIIDDTCPVAIVIGNGVQTNQRVSLACRDNQRTSVAMRIIPVVKSDGTKLGAAIVLRDVTSQQDLEKRVQHLHRKATRDPLTKVHNRAEFDRTHEEFIADHTARKQPYSLIVCDIDRFKQVNDTYGHQAGDEILVSFAALLQRCCRRGDMVARYGGEEFVILCADCDNATAAARAEQTRIALANTVQPVLNNARLTASFGVTELQSGDTPESIFRRADRAVYKAKAMGRNTVIQLGCGMSEETSQTEEATSKWWSNGYRVRQSDLLIQKTLVTDVRLEMVVQKLRGFVMAHEAEIVFLKTNQVLMHFERDMRPQRRRYDRAIPLTVEIIFGEQADQPVHSHAIGHKLHVKIRPKRNRDRRLENMQDRATQLYSSLKSYLLADECSTMGPETDVDDGDET